jgi:glycerol-3-phosphate dehydrogenase (NAD(P)+)
VLTCTGDLSRNRQVGLRLARGQGIERILRELGHVAEGVTTAGELIRLSEKLDVDMPITRAVGDVLFQGQTPQAAVESLLHRDPRRESG